MQAKVIFACVRAEHSPCPTIRRQRRWQNPCWTCSPQGRRGTRRRWGPGSRCTTLWRAPADRGRRLVTCLLHFNVTFKSKRHQLWFQDVAGRRDEGEEEQGPCFIAFVLQWPLKTTGAWWGLLSSCRFSSGGHSRARISHRRHNLVTTGSGALQPNLPAHMKRRCDDGGDPGSLLVAARGERKGRVAGSVEPRGYRGSLLAARPSMCEFVHQQQPMRWQ